MRAGYPVLAAGGGGVAGRRKSVAKSLAEALRLRQEVKLAEARRASQPPRAAARPRTPRPKDPQAEQARLAAQGEKLLKGEEAEQARKAARIEADLLKRQSQRKRETEAQQRERDRAAKEKERTQRQQQAAALKEDAEERTRAVTARLRDIDLILAGRLGGLHTWHPRVERELRADGAPGLAAVLEDLQRRSPVPAGCRTGVEAAYAPEALQVVLNLDLPALDQVPVAAGYRFVAARLQVLPQPFKDGERNHLYRTLVARLVLRALDEVFAATPEALVDTIVVNGFVPTVDPTSGRPVRPCVVSVVAARSDVQALVLDAPALDAQRCLRAIGATVSEHPHDLEPVAPVVDPDLSRYRITADAAAVTGLDSRADLLQMDPFVFERLVRQLFEAMGYDTWRTQGSRDEGVDAVAVKRDAVAATVFAIQAKRTKNHVPVETVRALAGTMQDLNASHGVLVTTSWYGKTSTDFATRNGRIHLIDGRHLKSLLLEHLGIDALIGLPRVPRGWNQGDVS